MARSDGNSERLDSSSNTINAFWRCANSGLASARSPVVDGGLITFDRAPTAAQTTTSQTSGQQLPNCAVTTAKVGSMDVTEFFGLGGDVSGFGQAFGPTASVSKAATGTGATANATTDNTVTPNTAGAATDNTAGGTTTGDTTITPSVIGGNGTTLGAGGTAPTTGATGATGTTGTGATGTTAGTGTTGAAGTGTTAGTTGATGTGAVTSAATMSLAQSCIRLEVANPSPGDLLEPGSYVVQGFAFDPTTPASMGSGISGIQVFLGDPNEGGQIVGSVGTGAATSTGATADNFGIASSGAAAFGPQFGMAGFSVTVQIPQEAANPDSGSQAGLFVSATAQNNERVGTVAVPILVVNPDATP